MVLVIGVVMNFELILISILIAMVAAAEYFNKGSECAEHAVVKEILALRGRDATVKLADGREWSVNQAILKPGDTICLRWRRINNDQ
jgi:hypothetical protein